MFYYVQRMRLPSQSAHAIYTCAMVRALVNAGADFRWRPGGAPEDVRFALASASASRSEERITPQVRPFGGRSKGLYGAAFRLWLLRGFLDPDVKLFLATNLKEAAMLTGMARVFDRIGLRKKIAYEIHHLQFETKEGPERHRLMRLEAAALARADALLPINEHLAERVRAFHGTDVPQLILPMAYDPAVFSPVRATEGGPPVIAYFGSLHVGKGVDALVHAMNHLPTDWRLAVIGGNPSGRLEELKRLAAETGVAGRVEFPGQVEQTRLKALLEKIGAGLLAIPQDSATDFFSPMKVAESLALGLPILATPLPHLLDVLTPDVNAVFADSMTALPEALAQAALRLTPDMAAAMRRENPEAAARFAYPARAARLLEFLDRIG